MIVGTSALLVHDTGATQRQGDAPGEETRGYFAALMLELERGLDATSPAVPGVQRRLVEAVSAPDSHRSSGRLNAPIGQAHATHGATFGSDDRAAPVGGERSIVVHPSNVPCSASFGSRGYNENVSWATEQAVSVGHRQATNAGLVAGATMEALPVSHLVSFQQTYQFRDLGCLAVSTKPSSASGVRTGSDVPESSPFFAWTYRHGNARAELSLRLFRPSSDERLELQQRIGHEMARLGFTKYRSLLNGTELLEMKESEEGHGY